MQYGNMHTNSYKGQNVVGKKAMKKKNEMATREMRVPTAGR